MNAPVKERRGIEVRGIVQGVGFRPFIHALAREHGLAGQVRNDAEGVQIEVEGAPHELEAFTREIVAEAPPLAVVEAVAWQPLLVRGERGFHIAESRAGLLRRALISPDVAVCAACLEELFDPADRRYRYPFINCTNCGPRFTITTSVPYDRATTTMAGFAMCPECQCEYDNPEDRRFHAQPNACPECGPRVWLENPHPNRRPEGARLTAVGEEPTSLALRTRRSGQGGEGSSPIADAASMLRDGAIVAVKGLGGYHLACNPFDPDAVGALRSRKVRQDKPLAIMARDLNQARALCVVSETEAELLTSPARPIVLLERRVGNGVSEDVAPRQRTLGVMLAYTPLHHLLLADAGMPLVMTSGNRSDEPIAYRDDEAFGQLGAIADAFLVHDRPIHMRCDDSVTQVFAGSAYPIRRSRGYAPAPLRVAEPFGGHILACGGELKSTFCVAKERHAFLSHHIGDLENYETYRSFEEGIDHFCRLFDIQPEVIAYDLHPEYLSTKYAREREEAGAPAVGIQHHHAHVAACLADNERPAKERVIGVALDGTGYGPDGAIWGGEFFSGGISDGFARRGRLAYAPLPGGDAAIRHPWRGAVARLVAIFGEEEALRLPLDLVRRVDEREMQLVARMTERGLHTPLTSSAGRLFDAVAALVGTAGSMQTTYEGQAAIELQVLAEAASTETGSYPIRLSDENEPRVIAVEDIVAAVVADLVAGVPGATIAARFHRTMAEVVVAVCLWLRAEDGAHAVALSGGVFQNTLLLRLTESALNAVGFTVYRHRRVPTNDGGLALGQAVLANQTLQMFHGLR